ncbi:MAG: methyltransferase [Candidatus Aminicenantes bacterium]|nr:methyltransferase [Candidatus Aminicenantes bacterium]
MRSRQRLKAAINHHSVDRVPVDFGASAVTGIGVGTAHRLRQALLPDEHFKVKVIEPYQMLGEIDEIFYQVLGLDVAGIFSPKTMFGFKNESWKPFTLFDGTEVLVPGDFNVTRDKNNDLLIYPEGDLSALPRGRMPVDGYFFDAIIQQEPINDNSLNPEDNLEEFSLLSDEDIDFYKKHAQRLFNDTDAGIFLTLPGLAFGDIALVPAPWLKNPKGIRDVEEWYVSTLTRRDYIYTIFEKQCEIGLKNIDLLADAVGDLIDVVFVTGTDFGTQKGPFISPQSYRDLFYPFHKEVNKRIHAKTNWKTFIHSCGSVTAFMPDFINAGFDILNPVQTSAENMAPEFLKKEFGSDIVFWGGGVDTQKTLPFGTPDEVYREVITRLEIFSQDSGYVFNSIHNIQSNIPIENLLSMFQAIWDFNGFDYSGIIHNIQKKKINDPSLV